jgi:hypothetical protein
MRGVRSFLVLLVILLGLGGYLYFVESKRDPVAGEKKEKVFTVQADQIDEITIKSESGDRTTLRKTGLMKTGTDWQIVAPLAAQPDGAEISALTTNLNSLEIQEVLEENPSDLAEYGLAQPRVEVSFKSGGKEQTLHLGRRTPPGTDMYAKRSDEKKVFLVSGFLDSTFNRTTFDLRDKTVLKLDRDKIDVLSVVTPKRTLRFSKASGEWQMTDPFKARADFTGVDGIVSRINTLQMKSIATGDHSKLAEYELDKPQATVKLGSGSSQAALLIGKSAGEGVVYAKDQSRPVVMTIDAQVVTDLTKEPGEFRQKDFVDARTFTSTRFEVVRGGQTFAFEKTKTKNKEGQEEEKWKQVAPKARDVDAARVDKLLTILTGIQATSFIDSTAKTGLDKPELSVTIKSDEGRREEKYVLARVGKDGFGSRAGEPGAAKVDVATIDNIIKALEELK